MEKHLLSLRYDGLDAATHNGIGTAGSKQVIGGAQILLGERAQSGSAAPKGFPRSNSFGPVF